MIWQTKALYVTDLDAFFSSNGGIEQPDGWIVAEVHP